MAPPEEPADGASSPLSLPIFDLSHPSQALADSLVAALQTYGFLFLKSTSLPLSSSDISTTFSLASAFFHSPPHEKAQVPMQADNRGWTAMHGEELDPSASASASPKKGDPKEAFNFGEFSADAKAAQPLPRAFAEPPSTEQHFARFQAGCRDLCLRLLALIGQGLRVDDSDWFVKRHDQAVAPSGSILRLLYYPASSSDHQNSLRAGAHSDYGSLTLLFRRSEDPGGLEIQTESGWSAVPVRPRGTEADPAPPVLVNVGDLLSYWTGGLLRSTVHRVTFGAGSGGGSGSGGRGDGDEDEDEDARAGAAERYSIAYFNHPCRDTLLEPVPSQIVQEYIAAHPPQGTEIESETGSKSEPKIMTATEHLQARLRATYGWKEEVRTA